MPETKTEQTIVIATFSPKPGQEEPVERVLRGMTEPSRREPGCVRYDLYRTTNVPAMLTLFEIYDDEAAFALHRETPHYKAYRAKIAELLNGPIQVQILRALDVAR